MLSGQGGKLMHSYKGTFMHKLARGMSSAYQEVQDGSPFWITLAF